MAAGENTMQLEELLQSGLPELGIPAEAEILRRLRIYHDNLEETNKVMNLTAISGEEDVARLHFLDCAALLQYADLKGKRVIDVGTGAGFPGLVLKALCPEIELTLLDSLDKRIHFLQQSCGLMGLDDVLCLHARAEEVTPDRRGAYDVATARAVAGLNVLSELCLPYVKKGGLFLAMKGPDCAAEVKEAGKAIARLGGKVEAVKDYVIPGTEIHHAVVLIRKVADTPKQYPRRWAMIKKQPL